MNGRIVTDIVCDECGEQKDLVWEFLGGYAFGNNNVCVECARKIVAQLELAEQEGGAPMTFLS